MGFRLMENFNRPFLATNLQDFWNRWHISLTSIVRDYVFTPLYHFIAVPFPPPLAVCRGDGRLLLRHDVDRPVARHHLGILRLRRCCTAAMLICLQLFRRFVYPRFGPALREFYNHSPAVTWASRAADLRLHFRHHVVLAVRGDAKPFDPRPPGRAAIMNFANCAKIVASLLWLAVKVIVIVLLANSDAAQFVYQKF